MRPRYCRSADARMRMQNALLLTPLGSLRVFAPGGGDPAYVRGGDARRLA